MDELPYVLRAIVPEVRGGSLKDEKNVALWKRNFYEAYELFFRYLTPAEACRFIRLINVGGERYSEERLRIKRLQAAFGESEEILLDRLQMRSSPDMIELHSYDEAAAVPKMKGQRRTNLHHILPRSRGGQRNKDNAVHWPIWFHDLYHRMFNNLTVDEIEDFIIMVNRSYQETAMEIQVRQSAVDIKAFTPTEIRIHVRMQARLKKAA
jgi:hypothetical protein